MTSDQAQRNIDSIASFYRWYEQDGTESALARLEELVAPEVEFSPLLAREVEGGEPLRGVEAMRKFFRELHQILGDARYEELRYEPVSDDLIVVSTRLVGTARGSSVPIGQDLGLVYEFEDGLATRMTAFGSQQEALDAAKAIKSGESARA